MNLLSKKIISLFLLIQLSLLSINAVASDSNTIKNMPLDDKIKIEIISDVVCPWCAIGYKRLSTAIEELKLINKVEITWHPFQLNPDMPREGQNADKYLMNKLGLSKDALLNKRSSVTKTGEESGFKFDYFRKMKKLNTLNSHILLDYAKEYGKQTELKVRLQEAYFGERKNISNRTVLANELKVVGLNAVEALARLDDETAILHVQNEEKLWRNRGVYAIPTMVFDNSVVRVGANEVATYKQILIELTKKRAERKQ